MSFFYTADDERVLVFVNQPAGTPDTWSWTLRDLGGKLLRDLHTTPEGVVVDKDYIYRGDQLLGYADYTEPELSLVHLSLDHLGTPRLETDAETGAYRRSAKYYPFGQEIIPASDDALRLRFTGHERDTFAALITGDENDYLHARSFSPDTGRFVSPDQHPGSPRLPQSWNRYSYGHGSPEMFVDPDGRDVILAVRSTDMAPPKHSFLMVQPTGENRRLFASRIDKNLGRVVLSSGPGNIVGREGRRLVKRDTEHLLSLQGGETVLYYIQPRNQTKEQFERNVIQAFDSYENGSEKYNNFGILGPKNSNSLPSGVLDAAGAGDAKPDLSIWGWGSPVELPDATADDDPAPEKSSFRDRLYLPVGATICTRTGACW